MQSEKLFPYIENVAFIFAFESMKYSHFSERNSQKSCLWVGQNFLEWNVIPFMARSMSYLLHVFSLFFLEEIAWTAERKIFRKKGRERGSIKRFRTPPNPIVFSYSLATFTSFCMQCACVPVHSSCETDKKFSWMNADESPIPDVYRLACATHSFLFFFASFSRFSFALALCTFAAV